MAPTRFNPPIQSNYGYDAKNRMVESLRTLYVALDRPLFAHPRLAEDAAMVKL